MNAVLVEDRPCHSVPGWHDEFLTHILPAVETIARIRFRGLPACEQEEGLAEAVAGAMICFVRLVRRGKNPAVFAGRLAQVAVFRVLAGRLTGTSDNSFDVLSRHARRRRGFTVGPLPDSTQAESEWEEILTENGRCTPADLAASRIDFSAWLDSMTGRRRKIAQSLAAGYQTVEVAREFHLSPGRVSQLRRELEVSWNAFQGDVTETSSPSYPSAA
jgi:hypothetical protein